MDSSAVSRRVRWLLIGLGLLLCGGMVTAGPALAGRAGIGLQVVALPGGQLVVVQVVPDSPAQHAGFRPGDLLLSIDGRSLAGSKLAKVSRESLWGKAGKAATIRFMRPGEAGVYEVKVTRGPLGEIPQAPVEVQMLQPQQGQEKETKP